MVVIGGVRRMRLTIGTALAFLLAASALDPAAAQADRPAAPPPAAKPPVLPAPQPRPPVADKPPPPVPSPAPSDAPTGEQQPAPEAKPAEPAKEHPSAAVLAPIPPDEVINILGETVRGPASEDMGMVVDVLVDAEGRPRAAVIDFGGFLGVGSRKIAVGWQALTFRPADKSGRVLLSLGRAEVQAAPEYNKPKGQPAAVVTPAAERPADAPAAAPAPAPGAPQPAPAPPPASPAPSPAPDAGR